MGKRRIRLVTPDWEHPKDQQGNFIPLLDWRHYRVDLAERHKQETQWELGKISTNPLRDEWRDATEQDKKKGSGEFLSQTPDKDKYMPVWWLDTEATHFQLYEISTEGTPVSPVMESKEALASWMTVEYPGVTYTACMESVDSMLVDYGYERDDLNGLSLNCE